jgi:poly-gamma-glutamate capsule biosynthesis protein CapA/YwtB (metallophosphatase superfamily)
VPAGAAGQASDPRYEPPTVELGWVGDMAFGEARAPGGPRRVLRSVRAWLKAPDLMAGNLEGTLGSGGTSKCATSHGGSCVAFQAPAGYAGAFKSSGFDVVNLANNHTNDFGPYGMRETRAALRRARLPHSGLRGRFAVLHANHVRVAYVGFAPYSWANDLRDLAGARRLVRKAGRRADVVVVMMHAGAEGESAAHVPHGHEYGYNEDRGNTRAFAHAVVTAGADLVVGSGPHVLRGIECYRQRVIAYSLANFAGYRTLKTDGLRSLSGLLSVELAPDGTLVSGRLRPLRFQYPDTPRPGGRSISLVRRLSREDFGHRACRILRHGYIEMP